MNMLVGLVSTHFSPQRPAKLYRRIMETTIKIHIIQSGKILLHVYCSLKLLTLLVHFKQVVKVFQLVYMLLLYMSVT